MKILVTGAAGLYGIHLVDELVKRADVSKVIGLDNFSRNYLFAEKFVHKIQEDKFRVIKGYYKHSNTVIDKVDFDANFVVVDPFIKSPEFHKKFKLMVRDYQSLTKEEIDEMNVDAIIHLAASISIPESMIDNHKYFENNEFGTFNLMHTLVQTKTKPVIIYASSPEVYGNPEYIPMDEKHPMKPRSTYAVTKLAAEKHCRAMYKWHKYPVIIIRNFNTFGENQNLWDDAAVVSNFISAALKGEDLIINDDGQQTRDFQYVKDAVKAYSLVLGKPDIVGEIFNIGTGIQTTILDLAKKIIELTESKSKIIFKGARPADVRHLHADFSAITKKTGWSPQFSLVDGLKRTIEWYKIALKIK